MKRNHTAKSKTIAATATAKLSGMPRKAISMMQPKKNCGNHAKDVTKETHPANDLFRRALEEFIRQKIRAWKNDCRNQCDRHNYIAEREHKKHPFWIAVSQAAATKRQDFFR